MIERQRIPEGLAEIPPGPELATMLSQIELSRLCGFDAVEVLRAQYRQLNHDQARLMATVVEVGLADSGPDDELARRAAPDEFAADEVRDRLLPRLGELTTGQLVDQIKKLAIAVDPDWARRRYERAVADRKVVGHRNPDGSANLSGQNMPLDRVATASARIDALAKAAKRAGSSRPIDHLRTELFLGMTDGTYSGLADDTILELLVATGDGRRSQDGQSRTDSPRGDDPGTGVATRGRGRGGIELRVRLSTLLGHDKYPGELAGWGHVHADLARELVPGLLRAEWRFVITDDRGHLHDAGITRTRPTGSSLGTGRSPNIVELHGKMITFSNHPTRTTTACATARVRRGAPPF